jgi:hypothetical protein
MESIIFVLFVVAGFLLMPFLRFRPGFYGALKSLKESNSVWRKQVISLFMALLIIFLIFVYTNKTPLEYIGLLALIIIALAYMLLFSKDVLPEVNEMTIWIFTLLFWFIYITDYLSKQIIIAAGSFAILPIILIIAVLLGRLALGETDLIRMAMAIPTLGALFMLLTKRKIGSTTKTLFYIWFMLILLTISLYQVENLLPLSIPKEGGSNERTQTILETISTSFTEILNGLIVGAALFNLLALGLYLGYTFGRRRKIIRKGVDEPFEVFPAKYSDAQSNLPKAIIVTIILTTTLYANIQYHVVPDSLLIGLWVIEAGRTNKAKKHPLDQS